MTNNRGLLSTAFVGLALFLVLAGFVGGCVYGRLPVEKPDVPVVVPEPVKPKVDRVVYVYEKDDHAVPNEIKVVIDKLNRAGIEATSVDDDVTDGTGQIPDQYKVAIDAARLSGLPAFVLLAKGEFLEFADMADLQKLLEESK